MFIIVNLETGVVRVLEEILIEEYAEVYDSFAITYCEVDDDTGELTIYEVQEDGSLDSIDPE